MPAERLRVACVQMDMRLGDADGNFAHAEELVRAAVEREHPDVVVLPETWNTGFFPEDLSACADRDGMRTKETFSRLAKELHVHVVAGSVADRRDGRFCRWSGGFCGRDVRLGSLRICAPVVIVRLPVVVIFIVWKGRFLRDVLAFMSRDLTVVVFIVMIFQRSSF